MTEDKKQLQPQTPSPKTKKTNHSFGQEQELKELSKKSPSLIMSNRNREKQINKKKKTQSLLRRPILTDLRQT